MDQHDNQPVVQMHQVSVTFPGAKALDQVDFTLRRGEIHSLMGENGAGKSTLIKALTGVNRLSGGSIVVDGSPVSFDTPAQAQAAGVSTVYQEVNLCDNLSVAENVVLGFEKSRGGLLNWRAMRRLAAEKLAELNLDIDPASILGEHSIAVQQLVAIARALVIDCKVLILDEPTSSLDKAEAARLFQTMRSLRDQGVAILFVSHFLDQVYEVSDRLTVLRNGRLVGEYLPSELDREALVGKMIGRAAEDLEKVSDKAAQLRPSREGTPLLSVLGLGRKGGIEPYDLDVYPGEVVGLAGLLGSGRTELARLVYGADHADQGTLSIEGTPVGTRNPRTMLGRGVAYSSESRKTEGIVADLSVRDNILLGLQAQRGWLRRIPRDQADEVVSRYMKSLDVRPPNPNALASALSGGNQQKVLLARWLATAPKLLILDEPTRGIDVGAKAEIQQMVANLAAQGMSIIFISAELEEVLRLSTRLAVLRDRRKVAEVDNTDLQLDEVVQLIATGDAQ